MFERLTEAGVPEVLDYFSRDRKNCLYSYIDLKKYGLSHPNLALYTDRDEAGICCVLTKYFGGVNVFSDGNRLKAAETVRMLRCLDPDMISAPAGTLGLLKEAFAEDYVCEQGYVTEIRSVRREEAARGRAEAPEGAGPADAEEAARDRASHWKDEVEEALEADLPEIARLICTDEGLGGTYEPESFAKRLLELRRDGFGRNYCIRREGRIVCHAGTYAEVEDLAVISGVITAEDCRGQKLADKVVSKLSSRLLAEGKLPCLFYFTKSAGRLYENVGFAPGSPWAKLTRKQGQRCIM